MKVVVLFAALLIGVPTFGAETIVEGRSETRFQLRRDLEGTLRAPLIEDLYGAFTTDLPGAGDLSGYAMLKLDTVFPRPGGNVDLYVASLVFQRAQQRLRLALGRQFLQTPAGLRLVDGASLQVRPTRVLRLQADAGWLRDTERDDLWGGAFLLQGQAALTALPGARLAAQVGFRVGPDTSARGDARVMADAVLPVRLAPQPWIDAAFRLGEQGLRHLRGGLILHPLPSIDLQAQGRVDRVVDEDGTLAQRILADLTASDVASLGGDLTIRGGHGLAVSGGYRASHYLVSADLETVGHSIDVQGAWRGSRGVLLASWMLRSGFGGVFTAFGVDATVHLHPAVRLQGSGQVVPYHKLRGGWKTAASVLAEAGFRPIKPLELAVGVQYRTGEPFAHDLRVHFGVELQGLARRTR